MKKSIFLLLCISVLFSCTKKEDFFDPHHIDEEAKENFPVKDIDPSQDWNMAAVGTLSVSINQRRSVGVSDWKDFKKQRSD